jgi:cation diffusion facilitator family transporter
MSSCCDDKGCAIDELRERQSGTLKIVLAINAVMFIVEAVGGYLASSTALLSDSLDNLGDALTYGLSLYVVARSDHEKAKVALVKGALIAAAALAVVAQIVYRLFVPTTPIFEVMGGLALLALATNSVCLMLLWRHRKEDINMMSVWECSRNDIASNVAVLVAAGTVWWLGSGWPDLVVAIALATLLLVSAGRVLRRAIRELSAKPQVAAPQKMTFVRK